MNIFHKMARESMRKNRTRTWVTILGVILSAALITGVTVLGYSLLQVLIEDAVIRYGDWHLSVPKVDEAFLQEQTQRAEVDAVGFYEEWESAALPTDDGDEVLHVLAFPEETFSLLPVTVLSGRLPQTEGELLLGANLAFGAGIGWKTGQQVTLSGNGGDREYTIVGICARPNFGTQYNGTYTAITRLEQSNPAAVKTALIRLNNPYSIASFADSLDRESRYHANVLRFMGIWEDPADSLITRLMATAGTIIIGIVMIGSIFLIFNAFHISLNERTREIGLLASVGATPAQIRSMVLQEGFFLGAVGIPLGVGVGIGAVSVLIRAIADSFSKMIYLNLPLKMVVSLPILLFAMLISQLTILISAYIPARKAAKQPVMECIRQTNEIKVPAKTIQTSRLSQRFWGLEGTLALKNFKRNQKQYRSIILSLVLSIALFLSTSAFTDSFRRVSEKAEVVTDYDIGFSSLEMSDADLIRLWGDLRQTEGITDSTMQAVYLLDVQAENGSYTAAVQFLDEENFRVCLDRWGLDAAEYGKILPAVAKRNGEADRICDLPDLFSTEMVSAQMNQKTVTLHCIEQIFPDIPPYTENIQTFEYTLMILAPWNQQEALAGDQEPFAKGLTFCSEDPEKSTEDLRGKIQGASVTEAYLLLNNAAVFSQNRGLMFIANVFSYTFILMISLIAAANVFNTISTNLRLRRRELAMIRSVGMSDRSFQKMMRFECVFYGLRAIAFGVPLSLGLSWGIQNWLMDGVVSGNEAKFQMPWLPMGISVVAVLLIIFVTMMYTVNKLKRENIMDALRDEMT